MCNLVEPSVILDECVLCGVTTGSVSAVCDECLHEEAMEVAIARNVPAFKICGCGTTISEKDEMCEYCWSVETLNVTQDWSK